MRKSTQYLILFLLILVVFGLVVFCCKPANCPLCNFMKSHAPCLVNVKTGEIEEMALYAPHGTLVGEIAEEQTDSTFSFVDIAGARGTRLSSPFIMELDVPNLSAPRMKRHFCQDCRKLLSSHGGYVIADLYEPGNPVIYTIFDGMRLELRCYSIVVDMNTSGDEYALTVEGTYAINGGT